MVIYFYPNDDFAIVYCIGRICFLEMKLIVCCKILFQFENVFNDNWNVLTPKGGGYI